MKILHKNKILSFILAMVMVLTAIPLGTFHVFAITDKDVTIEHNGKIIDSLLLAEDEEELLTAKTKNIDATSYRWQICINKENNSWVTISDRRTENCKVNFALIKAQIDNTNTAYLRCAVNDGTADYFSDAVAVTVNFNEHQEISFVSVSDSAETPAPETVITEAPKPKAKAKMARVAETAPEIVSIIIEYRLEDGTPAWESERFNIAKGEGIKATVTLPSIVGYTANLSNPDESIALDLTKGVINLDVQSITADKTYTVVYTPGLTEYTIVHHLQNINNDLYDSSFVETGYGLTGTLVEGDLHKSGDTNASNYDARMEGFSHLAYENLVIAADGNTAIHIYYNRNYYSVVYDYSDCKDAYGVESILVRYGTEVFSKNPTRPGYDFAGWKLVGCRVGQSGDFVKPTADQENTYNLNNGKIVVPNFNLKYIPTWRHSLSSFTVVYWKEAGSVAGENTPVQYEFWGSRIVGYEELEDGELYYSGVKTGDIIKPADYKDVPSEISNFNDGNTTINELNFLEYNAEKTEKIPVVDGKGYPILDDAGNPTYTDATVVKGDGTSVVNIYYDRKEYTLKFYYGAQSGNNKYVFGRTNYFGTDSLSYSNRNDEIYLLDRVWSSDSYETQVEDFSNVEKLKSNTNYVFNSETSNSNRVYYYFSFTAKYGSDISKLWPSTAIMGTATMTQNGKYYQSNSVIWQSDQCTFSGWNGEVNTYYTQLHKNDDFETIKGEYRRLDHRILWDTSLAATSNSTTYNNTVSYLAYWSNAAASENRGGWFSTNWSVPALYRYNIYLECVDQGANHNVTTCQYKEKHHKLQGGKHYYLASRYDVADNCEEKNLSKQTYPPVDGFKNIRSDRWDVGEDYVTLAEKTDSNDGYDPSMYIMGYDIFWFYDREYYDLKFNNMGVLLKNKDADGNEILDRQTIRYGVKLYREGGTYDLDEIYEMEADGETPKRDENGNKILKHYPHHALDPDGYEFEGWYTTPTFADGTVYTFDKNSTMPKNNMELYARWVKKTHRVSVYLSESDMIAEKPMYKDQPFVDVLHSDMAPTPADPEPLNGDAFAGWFYRDEYENDLEKPFMFSSPIIHDMQIYAKYQSNVPVEYKVFYQAIEGFKKDENGKFELDENGEKIPIPIYDDEGKPVYVAKETSAWNVSGTDVTIQAKTGKQLYEKYQDGWFPDLISQDLRLDKDSDKNSVTVYYLAKPNVPYKVRYVDENDVDLKDAKIVSKNTASVVTENFVPIEGYLPNALQQRLVLSAPNADTPDEVSPENVITFVYTNNEGGKETIVQVIEYCETLIEGIYTEYNTDIEENVKFDSNSTFTYEIRNDIIGFEFNSDKTQINNTDAPDSVENGVITCTLNEGGLLIEIYYDRKPVKYEVRYVEMLDNNTTKPLIKPDEDEGKHGQNILAAAKTFIGYELIDDTKSVQQLTLDSAKDANVIIFTYKQSQVVFEFVAVGDKNVKQEWLSRNSTTISSFADTLDSHQSSKPYEIVKADNGVSYRFVGWFLDASATEPVSASMVSSDNTITPQKTRIGDKEIYVAATFYALFEAETADLVIKTAFPKAQGEYSSIDPNKTFIFKISGADENNRNVYMTVSIHGKGTATIKNMPTGNYVVEYLSGWNWRYDLPQNQTKFDVKLTADGYTVTAVPTRNGGKWLDADNYEENIFPKTTNGE